MNNYTPGQCNIGKEEVNIRRKWLAISIIDILVFTFLCFDRGSSSWLNAFLFISSFALSIIYIEVKQRFCVIFGMAGVFNFNKPGRTEKITDKNSLLKDRQKVLKILLISFLFALIYTLLISFLSRLLV